MFSVGQILKCLDRRARARKKKLFYALVNLLIPARVCKCWKLAGLRPEVLQGPGTAVQPQLQEPAQEGLCMQSHCAP